MKVKIVSDQHLEFRASNGSYRKYFNAIHPTVGEMADVCVVAGDFDVIGPRSQAFFQELCNREQQMLYVSGNHEYYRCISMESVDDTLREFEQGLTNLVVLRAGAAFEFAGTRFLGDTMWVPKTPDLIMSAGLINDARLTPACWDKSKSAITTLLAGSPESFVRKTSRWRTIFLRNARPQPRTAIPPHSHGLWHQELKLSLTEGRELGFTGIRTSGATTC